MISVCLASYNGEKYIKEQIDSILLQLPNDAEVIISDDGSKDSTIQIVKSFNDERIKVVQGPQKGIVKNFENAINESNGDIIFLSDQDDVWMPNKVSSIMKAFEDKNLNCILHDAVVTDAGDNILMPSLLEWRSVKHGVLYNLLKNSYTGCCMAIRREFLNRCIPFPENIAMHDWWIGLLAEREGKTLFLYEKLIKYRRHSNNANSLDGYSITSKVTNRLSLIKPLLKGDRG